MTLAGLQHVGIRLVLALQRGRSGRMVSDQAWSVISELGAGPLVYAAVAASYWLGETVFGLQLASTLFLSGAANQILKRAWALPRPFLIDRRVRFPKRAPRGPGLPSGHAQLAATLWLSVGWRSNSRWVWTLGIFATSLAGYSRVRLGVHFPHDVIVGWVLGGLCAYALTLLRRRKSPVSEHSNAATLSTALLGMSGSVALPLVGQTAALWPGALLLGLAGGDLLSRWSTPSPPSNRAGPRAILTAVAGVALPATLLAVDALIATPMLVSAPALAVFGAGLLGGLWVGWIWPRVSGVNPERPLQPMRAAGEGRK